MTVISCKWQLPPSSHTGQSCGWLVINHSTTLSRNSLASPSLMEINVPSDAGVIQDITKRPRVSSAFWYCLTAHWRQAPTLPSPDASKNKEYRGQERGKPATGC